MSLQPSVAIFPDPNYGSIKYGVGVATQNSRSNTRLIREFFVNIVFDNIVSLEILALQVYI